MTTEAAEFPERCPAWMGQTQGRQFQVCHCAPQSMQSSDPLGEGQLAQHFQILHHEVLSIYLAC
jgi:hypothetical protein